MLHFITFASGHVMVTISVELGCNTGNLIVVAGNDSNDPIIETASVRGACNDIYVSFIYSYNIVPLNYYEIFIIPRYPDCSILR